MARENIMRHLPAGPAAASDTRYSCFFHRHSCKVRPPSAMPKDNSRPLLTTSATDFALPNYNSAMGMGSPSSFSNSLDTSSSPYQRQRRPSVLMPKSYLTEPRLASPLQSSFKFASAPSLPARSSNTTVLSTSASTGSSSSSTSESSTPNFTTDEDTVLDHKMARAYRSPPRRYASAAVDAHDSHPYPKRKLSFPVRFSSSPNRTINSQCYFQ